jgi:hypothetical protein
MEGWFVEVCRMPPPLLACFSFERSCRVCVCTFLPACVCRVRARTSAHPQSEHADSRERVPLDKMMHTVSMTSMRPCRVLRPSIAAKEQGLTGIEPVTIRVAI